MKTKFFFCLVVVLSMIANTVSASLVNSNEDKFFIQAGAFKNINYAERLVSNLKQSGQNWFIENENGLYKVRLGFFDSKKMADSKKESLNNITCFVAGKKDKEIEKTIMIADNKKDLSNTFDTPPIVSTETDFIIQAGAFRIEKNAINLKNQLFEKTKSTWFITNENSFFKVREELSFLKEKYVDSIKNQTDTNIVKKQIIIYQQQIALEEKKQTQPEQIVENTEITQNVEKNAVQITANELTEQKKEINEKKDIKSELKGKSPNNSDSKKENSDILNQFYIVLTILGVLLGFTIFFGFLIKRKRKKRKEVLKDANIT